MTITKNDIGKYFLDENGCYWRMDGWIGEPAAILHKLGTNQETTVVFTAPIAKNYTLVDIDPDVLGAILNQFEGE
jgi:hypothetical protein